LIQDLKKQGKSMIVVAHNFIHIVEICDRVNFLQHGRITFDKPVSETSAEELTELVAAEYRASKGTKAAAAQAPA
jgi:ABC-type sugar transport system ATPase subunit